MRSVYIGRSNQLWFEVERDAVNIRLRAEYHSEGFPKSLLFPIDQVTTVCGMRLIGTHTDFKVIHLTPPSQESTHGQAEHQSPQEAIPREVQDEYRGLLAKELSEAIAKGLTPKKCKECCGNGLDHPCSAKSRNTDDDTCPHCKGTGIEPAPSPQQEQAARDSRPANHSDIDYGH